MKGILIFILSLAAVSVISGCFNPFFPETGTPPQIESSPAMTVQLLKKAYEQRDINAFSRLIYSTDDYSSYTQVSDDYSSSLTIFLSKIPVSIDTVFMENRFLPQNRYYYELNWREEYQIHEKMFRQSNEIVFVQPFTAGETLYDILGADTVSALVRTHSSQIRIKYGGKEFVMDITGQVFAMKKDDDVWKIWKWIELN